VRKISIAIATAALVAFAWGSSPVMAAPGAEAAAGLTGSSQSGLVDVGWRCGWHHRWCRRYAGVGVWAPGVGIWIGPHWHHHHHHCHWHHHHWVCWH
jgi:hypothetical protein